MKVKDFIEFLTTLDQESDLVLDPDNSDDQSDWIDIDDIYIKNMKSSFSSMSNEDIKDSDDNVSIIRWD